MVLMQNSIRYKKTIWNMNVYIYIYKQVQISKAWK